MKPKTMILMVVAVVCGLGASYMTSRLLAEREDQQPVTKIVEKKVETVPVLVAKKNLNMGDLLKDPKLFVEKQVPKGDETYKDAISDWKLLEGKTLRRQVNKFTHLTPDLLGDGSPVLEIPAGYQGIGLRVGLDASAAGWASLPGSRVDIIWTRKGENAKDTFSKTILQNVLVLAAGGEKTRREDGSAMPTDIVTLALSPEDTRRAVMATASGTMHLVVRIPGDTTIHKNNTTTLGDVIGDAKQDKQHGEDPIETVTVLPREDNPPVAAPTAARTPTQVPVVEVKPRKTFVVWHRHGNKQWKEVVYLDDDGNPVYDDVQRDEAPQVSAQPTPPPGPTPPAQPAGPPGPSQPGSKN